MISLLAQNSSVQFNSLLLVGFGLFLLFAFVGTLVLIAIKKTRVFGIVLLGVGMLSVVVLAGLFFATTVQSESHTIRVARRMPGAPTSRALVTKFELAAPRRETAHQTPATELEVTSSTTTSQGTLDTRAFAESANAEHYESHPEHHTSHGTDSRHTDRPSLSALDTFSYPIGVNFGNVGFVEILLILLCLSFLFYNQKTRPYAYGLVGIGGCVFVLYFMSKSNMSSVAEREFSAKHLVEVQENIQRAQLRHLIQNANQTFKEKAQELKDKGKNSESDKDKEKKESAGKKTTTKDPAWLTAGSKHVGSTYRHLLTTSPNNNADALLREYSVLLTTFANQLINGLSTTGPSLLDRLGNQGTVLVRRPPGFTELGITAAQKRELFGQPKWHIRAYETSVGKHYVLNALVEFTPAIETELKHLVQNYHQRQQRKETIWQIEILFATFLTGLVLVYLMMRWLTKKTPLKNNQPEDDQKIIHES